jgi:hypothetical protein
MPAHQVERDLVQMIAAGVGLPFLRTRHSQRGRDARGIMPIQESAAGVALRVTRQVSLVLLDP